MLAPTLNDDTLKKLLFKIGNYDFVDNRESDNESDEESDEEPNVIWDNDLFNRLPAKFLAALQEHLIHNLKFCSAIHSYNEALNAYAKFVFTKPLGQMSTDLLSALYTYIDGRDHLAYYGESILSKSYVQLRISCEAYVKHNDPLNEHILKQIKEAIQLYKKKSFPRHGAHLSYQELYETNLLHSVYNYGDPALCELFYLNFPLPPREVLPNLMLQEKARARDSLIENFVKGHSSLSQLEQRIMTLQRTLRSHNKRREEKYRIPKEHDVLSDNPSENRSPRSFYWPKCHTALAARIVHIASNVKFLRRIKHETRYSAVTPIFNDALYGQKTLLQHFLPFKRAALHSGDVSNGDGNSVCFGAPYGFIDPQAFGDIEFELDLSKMNFDTAHCAFFKQVDFLFTLEAPEETVWIDQRSRLVLMLDEGGQTCHNLTLRFQDDGMHYKGKCTLENYELISYDIKNINLVLIMNFFRFLDQLGERSPLRNAIYAKFEKMSDIHLFMILNELGIKLSSRMEFNFYGAHKINFETLVEIRDRRKYHRLSMSSFISTLQSGNLDELFLKKSQFPQVFHSYRFVDYLASKIKNTNVLAALALFRVACDKVPSWCPMQNYLSNPLKRKHPEEESKTLDCKPKM